MKRGGGTKSQLLLLSETLKREKYVSSTTAITVSFATLTLRKDMVILEKIISMFIIELIFTPSMKNTK